MFSQKSSRKLNHKIKQVKSTSIAESLIAKFNECKKPLSMIETSPVNEPLSIIKPLSTTKSSPAIKPSPAIKSLHVTKSLHVVKPLHVVSTSTKPYIRTRS
ncbi:10858_t:CDS:1 [Cetraspora pellucida]|uniref:10858_t:CDS:1 n=1 Tax=Cetraspora pellucida TaxID=1433469 RepID=A0ACA9KNK0_9GLOM|nr:10858_t:CDS:1 [Cetraspora pellucida]